MDDAFIITDGIEENGFHVREITKVVTNFLRRVQEKNYKVLDTDIILSIWEKVKTDGVIHHIVKAINKDII